MSVEIIPTILCDTVDEAARRMRACEAVARQAQVDFADGEFVPHVLPEVDEVGAIPTQLHLEAHLMVRRPADWVEKLLRYEQFETVIVQAESEGDIAGLLRQIRAAGRKTGLALRPETPADKIESFTELLDQALVLMVNPGFNGSPFLPEMLDKISEIKKRWPQLLVEADGGENPATIGRVVQAGADRVAVGSFLQTDRLADGLAEMRQTVQREARL